MSARQSDRIFRAAVWAAFLGLMPAWASGQTATFTSRVEAVRVDVLVTQDKKTVGGLEPADFEVTDNGVRQRVELVSHDEMPLNVVIALDLSSSLTGERLSQLRRASASLASVLKQDDQAALVTFTETVALTVNLTTKLDDVRAAVAKTTPDSGTRPTALVDAVFAAVMAAESDVGRGLVVVFSDGVDTGSWLREPAVLEIVKRSDAVVYAVATQHTGRTSFLEDLTRASGGAFIEVEATDDIGAVFLGVLDEFRQRYLLSYSPTGSGRRGWHEVSVKVKDRRAKITSRPGYWSDR